MPRGRAGRPAFDDDIADPIGQPVEIHEAVGAAIAEALIPLLGRIAALNPPTDAVGGTDAA